jgi:hypothetical protein
MYYVLMTPESERLSWIDGLACDTEGLAVAKFLQTADSQNSSCRFFFRDYSMDVRPQ